MFFAAFWGDIFQRYLICLEDLIFLFITSQFVGK